MTSCEFLISYLTGGSIINYALSAGIY